MLESRDEWIEKRAYAIWEAEGYPSGRDAVHWEQASQERIIFEKSATKKAKTSVTPRAKRKAVIAESLGLPAAKAPPKRASKKAVETKV
ncbi:MAG TPA: DUF2934 domain-containing protein [Rhizobium sp.]